LENVIQIAPVKLETARFLTPTGLLVNAFWAYFQEYLQLKYTSSKNSVQWGYMELLLLAMQEIRTRIHLSGGLGSYDDAESIEGYFYTCFTKYKKLHWKRNKTESEKILYWKYKRLFNSFFCMVNEELSWSYNKKLTPPVHI